MKHIDLQGLGIFKIDTTKYEELKEILKLDSDFLLDLINFPAVPILCINVDKIEKEGLIPFGYIITEIGKERYQKLIDKNIITQ